MNTFLNGMGRFDSHLMYASIHDDFSEGLSSQAASFRQEELGENVIDVHVKSPLFLLIDEVGEFYFLIAQAVSCCPMSWSYKEFHHGLAP